MTTNKWIGLIAALVWYNVAAAQTSYPSAPAMPPDIVKAEYFIDNDPGLGLAVPIPVTTAANISGKSLQVPLEGITKGVHFLYLRTQDAGGKWSLTANRIFMNFSIPAYGTPANKAHMAEAEYFFDTDPGHGKGFKIALDNSDEIHSQSASANIPALSEGLHTFYLRTKDTSGKWSITAAKLFNFTSVFPYPTSPPAATNVKAAEAFIDNDPGYGKGIPLSITPGGNLSNFSFNLPLNGLSVGVHYLFVRSIENPWSLTAVKEFSYGSVLPLQWLYFKGELKNDAALLNWGTAAEVNTNLFHIQHSTDGVRFTTLADLAARPGSGMVNHYEYTHQTPAAGFNYYRIQQVDKDGKSTFSQVIQLLFNKGKAAVTLAPNPVINDTYVIQNTREFVKGYTIFNAAGQIVKSEGINALKEAVWALNLEKLRTGIYTLRIEYSQRNEVIPFIKK
jgi:hypothetical protein